MVDVSADVTLAVWGALCFWFLWWCFPVLLAACSFMEPAAFVAFNLQSCLVVPRWCPSAVPFLMVCEGDVVVGNFVVFPFLVSPLVVVHPGIF